MSIRSTMSKGQTEQGAHRLRRCRRHSKRINSWSALQRWRCYDAPPSRPGGRTDDPDAGHRLEGRPGTLSPAQPAAHPAIGRASPALRHESAGLVSFGASVP